LCLWTAVHLPRACPAVPRAQANNPPEAARLHSAASSFGAVVIRAPDPAAKPGKTMAYGRPPARR